MNEHSARESQALVTSSWTTASKYTVACWCASLSLRDEASSCWNESTEAVPPRSCRRAPRLRSAYGVQLVMRVHISSEVTTEIDRDQCDGFEQWRSFEADIKGVPGIQEGQQRLQNFMLDESGLDATITTVHAMDSFVRQANDQTKGAKPPQGIEGAMALTSPNDLKATLHKLSA